MHDEPNRIRIYVAADRAELGGVLDELGAFVAGRNRRCVRDGVVIEVAERGAESEDPGTAPSDSSYFVTLVGSTAPGFVVGDFDEAWEACRASGSPKVSAWRSLCEGEEPSPEVEAFVERLRGELLHYVPRLEHPAQLQLRVWQWLDADGALASPLEIRDGWARSGGEELVDMSGVPMYAGNAGIAAKRAEIAALDELFAARAAVGGPMSPEALEANKKRLGARGELRAMECSLLDACRRADEAESRGTASWRTVKARELIEAGNYGGALAVLDDPDRDAEYEQARALAAEGLRRIEQNIEEDRAWIAAKLATGFGPDVAEAVRTRYDEVMDKVLENHVYPDALFEYAKFLQSQFDHARIEGVIRSYLDELRTIGGDNAIRPPDAVQALAESLSKQAIMIGLGNESLDDDRDPHELFNEAQELFEEALSSYIEGEDGSLERDLAFTRCLLASYECTFKLYLLTFRDAYPKKFEKFIKKYIDCYQSTVERYEAIALPERGEALPLLAEAYERLASLYFGEYDRTRSIKKKPKKLAKAERMLTRAVELRKELAESEPSAYQRNLHLNNAARDLQQIAGFFKYEDNHKAESYLLTALDMYEGLEQERAAEHYERVIDWVYYELYEVQYLQGKQPSQRCEQGYKRASERRHHDE